MLPAVGHKATGWISKVVAMRCIDALPADEKARALAAYGLADILCNFMGRSAFYCATDALATFAAQSWGAGQREAVGVHAARAFLVALCVVYTPSVVLWSFGEPLLLAAGQAQDVAADAASFGHVRAPLLIFALGNAVMLKTFNAIGRPLPGMAANLTSVLVAAPMGWLLINHLRLGVAGAAYLATFVEAASSCVYAAAVVVGGDEVRSCFCRPTRRCLRDWGGYLRIAVPSFVMLMTEMAAWEVIIVPAGVCRPSPEAALAAFTLLYNVMYIAEAPGFGLASAAASLVGNALGEGRPDAARHAARVALALSATYGAVAALVFMCFSRALLGAFAADADATRLAESLLPELCACAFASNLAWTAGGVLAGAGRQRVTWPVSIFAYFVVGLPLGSVAAFVLWPAKGFEWLFRGLTIGLVLTTALYLVVILCRPGCVPCAISWRRAAAAARRRVQQSEGRVGGKGAPARPAMVLDARDTSSRTMPSRPSEPTGPAHSTNG
jgi:MATE family multidrug resistance protein